MVEPGTHVMHRSSETYMDIDLSPEQQMPEGMEWMLQAKCRGATAQEFFPSDGSGVERAMRVCDGCPVKSDCLEYALEQRIEHGVWGGASERERRRILKRRAATV
jgi:WhiB family transcriptional regulator, redox-sensing transcriptional regulator